MAPKVPKPKPKVMDKPVERLISKSKKHKKKKYHNFSIYIFKLLRAVSKDKTIGISRLTMVIMNNFINDMFEKIATEAGKFAMYGKKHTLGSREVQSAIKLVMPGELAKHANIEGTKAITMYHNSRQAEFRTKKPKPKATAVVGPVQT